ncbi:MAG: hypothetical protein DRR19_29500, partial [Candidatus Parabeggiatoa sp. nov. 1]
MVQESKRKEGRPKFKPVCILSAIRLKQPFIDSKALTANLAGWWALGLRRLSGIQGEPCTKNREEFSGIQGEPCTKNHDGFSGIQGELCTKNRDGFIRLRRTWYENPAE